MKNSILKITAFATVILNISCEKDSTVRVEKQQNISKEVQLSEDQLSALDLLGLQSDTGIFEVKNNSITNKKNGIIVNDIYLSYKQLNNIVNTHVKSTSFKRSARLDVLKERIEVPATGKRTITFGLFAFGDDGLNELQLNATITAIRRFKSLSLEKLDFDFVVFRNEEAFISSDIDIDTFVNSPADSDIKLSPNSNLDAVASFPEGGFPGFSIELRRRTRNSTTQENITRLMQHEIGHIIGFVHADHLTRRSCRGGRNENLSTSTIEQTAGTGETGNIINSIMRSCGIFSIRDFTAADKKSMRSAYR